MKAIIKKYIKMLRNLIISSTVYFKNCLKTVYSFCDVDLYRCLKQNKKYAGKYAGKRCFVLGNGPSIKLYDLSVLKQDIVFCVNEFYRFEHIDEIAPQFYLIADPVYFRLNFSNANDVDFVYKIKDLLNRGMKLWMPYRYKTKAYEYGWAQTNNVNYFHNNLQLRMNNKSLIDFSQCIPGMQAVIQYEILLAVYMGFSEIYLIGVEQTDIFSCLQSYIDSNSNFDYGFNLTEDERQWKRKQLMTLSLPELLLGYSKIFRLYSYLSRYCVENSVEIYNCSPNTLILDIKQKKFNDIFKGEGCNEEILK